MPSSGSKLEDPVVPAVANVERSIGCHPNAVRAIQGRSFRSMVENGQQGFCFRIVTLDQMVFRVGNDNSVFQIDTEVLAARGLQA